MEQRGPGGWAGSRCQEVVVRMVFSLVTASELEVLRTEVWSLGFGFNTC